MKNRVRIREQLQRNAVAIISLVVAITSLGYNTWRNEASEGNRNQRLISIEVLRNLSQLQGVVYHHTWDMDVEDKGNPRTGWIHVLTVKDLSRTIGGEVPESATALWKVWEVHWNDLEPENESYDRVIGALEDVRRDTHALLQSLD